MAQINVEPIGDLEGYYVKNLEKGRLIIPSDYRKALSQRNRYLLRQALKENIFKFIGNVIVYKGDPVFEMSQSGDPQQSPDNLINPESVIESPDLGGLDRMVYMACVEAESGGKKSPRKELRFYGPIDWVQKRYGISSLYHQRLKLDKQHRILIPCGVRKDFNIKKEVEAYGRIDHFIVIPYIQSQ